MDHATFESFQLSRLARAVVTALTPAFVLAFTLDPAAATVVQHGPEFVINTDSSGLQRFVHVDADANGTFVAVWLHNNSSVRARRFDSDGVPLGPEFTVSTNNNVGEPDVSVAADGSFVVAWGGDGEGSDYGVFGQRYDDTGAAIGSNFQVNTYTTGFQSRPAVALNDSGSFVIVWNSREQDGDDWGVFGQRYDSNGTPAGGEFQVNTYTTNAQAAPVVAADGSENFVVVWRDGTTEMLGGGGQDGDDYGVFGQRFDNLGMPLGTEFQVNTYTTGNQSDPNVAMFPDGRFVIVWGSGRGLPSFADVFGQRYDSTGVAQGGEFRVNDYDVQVQALPDITLTEGDFVVVWESQDQDGDGRGIFRQRYDGGGNRIDAEFQVNTYTIRSQRRAAVAALPGGSFVVAWEGATALNGQRFYLCDPACAACERCVPGGACVAEPRNDCHRSEVPSKSLLSLKVDQDARRDRLSWKWAKGDFTHIGEFGDPLTADDITVCIWENVDTSPSLWHQPVAPAGGLCAGKPCWKAKTSVFKYKDRERTPDGLDVIQLKAAAAGRAKIKLKGLGANLALPLPLGLDLPATVQLHAPNGKCWSSTYLQSGAIRDEPDSFKGRAGSPGGAFVGSRCEPLGCGPGSVLD